MKNARGTKIGKSAVAKLASRRLRKLGAEDARAGRPIDAFQSIPRIRHTESARASYEIGYRAEKEALRLIPQPNCSTVDASGGHPLICVRCEQPINAEPGVACLDGYPRHSRSCATEEDRTANLYGLTKLGPWFHDENCIKKGEL